jgi:UDP-N-acetyl-D-glucosamine dehydrogenase
MSYVVSATYRVAENLHAGLLVVLESTTYPGTTDEVVLPRMLRTGLVAGAEIFVAFSPERIDPANPVYGVRNTPKVIGGVTAECCAVAAALYGTVADEVVPVSTARTAEMVKLLENTFRAVNIGLINEVAIICCKLGVNVWEVIAAARTKPFGFMPFYPGPGLGGHCIPVDPLYLSWKMRSLNYKARFIELADEINGSMPQHVADIVAQALNVQGKPVRGSSILVLGAAYKRDVSDVRESPALDVMEVLLERGALIEFHDPYVPEVRLEGHTLRSQPYSAALLAAADCVLLITDHSCFDMDAVLASARLLVDTRNAAAGHTGSARVVTL